MGILSSHTRSLITDYMKEKQLPVIGFKHNSSMHDIVQSFFSASIGFSESTESALESFEQVGNTSYGKESMEELDKIACKMAEKLNASLKDIRDVTAASKTLLQDADSLFKKFAANDPVMAKFLNLQNEKIDKVVLNWDKLNDYSAESTLLLNVNMEGNRPNPEMVDIDSIPFHVNQLPYLNPTRNPEYKTLAASKDFDSFLTTVKADRAVEMGKILTDERAGKKFLVEMVMVFRPVTGSIYNTALEQTEKYLEYLQAFGLIRDTVKEDLTGFGEKEYESFQQNIETVQSYLDVMAYLIIGQRRTIYQDAYVLPNGHINSDNVQAFQDAGLTDMQTTNSTKYYMDVLGHLPSAGISVERMKQEMETVDKYINDRFTSAQFNSEAKIMEYRAKALRLLLNDKTKEALDKKVRGLNAVQMKAILDRDLDLFITKHKTDFDLVSDYLMAINHPFEMSEQLYKDFKSAYTQSLPDYGQVTNTDLKAIESKVIAHTVAQFVKKAFC